MAYGRMYPRRRRRIRRRRRRKVHKMRLLAKHTKYKFTLALRGLLTSGTVSDAGTYYRVYSDFFRPSDLPAPKFPRHFLCLSAATVFKNHPMFNTMEPTTQDNLTVDLFGPDAFDRTEDWKFTPHGNSLLVSGPDWYNIQPKGYDQLQHLYEEYRVKYATVDIRLSAVGATEIARASEQGSTLTDYYDGHSFPADCQTTMNNFPIEFIWWRSKFPCFAGDYLSSFEDKQQYFEYMQFPKPVAQMTWAELKRQKGVRHAVLDPWEEHKRHINIHMKWKVPLKVKRHNRAAAEEDSTIAEETWSGTNEHYRISHRDADRMNCYGGEVSSEVKSLAGTGFFNIMWRSRADGEYRAGLLDYEGDATPDVTYGSRLHPCAFRINVVQRFWTEFRKPRLVGDNYRLYRPHLIADEDGDGERDAGELETADPMVL